jgi:aminoglycoside 6'-N-acetyltransferase I|tara:strand:- start:55 stop:435 length:381 start_codon:yes stop_codon:yes gene_type:complete
MVGSRSPAPLDALANGGVWELYPLVVKPVSQGMGVGAALVADLEECIAARGGVTVTLGSDDETGLTSLSGIDLYPDITEHIRNIRNLNRHPYEFYQKQGYVITGVVPDANGWGKPDIMMSKRIGSF